MKIVLPLSCFTQKVNNFSRLRNLLSDLEKKKSQAACDPMNDQEQYMDRYMDSSLLICKNFDSGALRLFLHWTGV